ncbi:Skp-like protein [Marinobacterium nitratireducens]|uniref:Skp-like protein n=1 Tax=Marinobacterium nitratireducens TaxID=518897 RepID=A0A917ZC82_9GAMM|nr:OmpH family outer membrane protein [Marinobacterium nitratireducens]GGO78842.1 Skp-like protein [Marinobacterium nitratireducens]
MKYIQSALLALVMMFSFQAAAADKVAVLGVEEALLKSDAAADLRDQLKREFSGEEKQLLELEKQAKALQEKLRKNQGLQSKEDEQKLRLQFQKAFGQYQKQGQELQQKRAERERGFLAEMRPKLDEVIRDIIKKEKYDVVIAKQATVYSDKSVDITQTVIDALNKK